MAHIWLIKEGEPLPIDKDFHVLRTGRLAQSLLDQGHEVTWITSSFDHGRKVQRTTDSPFVSVSERYKIVLLPGPGYRKNISLARIIHSYRTSRSFKNIVSKLPLPDAMVIAYPSPELCYAAARFSKLRRIPYIVDVRDPWPDSFKGSVSRLLNGALFPLFAFYRFLLWASLKHAIGIVSMSRTMLDWSLKVAGRERRENDQIFFLGYSGPRPASQTPTPSEFTEENPLVCVFYGMFGKFHNGEVIIRAARYLEEANERRVRFVMMGDGQLRNQWEDLASGLKNITFTGWLDSLSASKYLEKAHVGCITISGGVSRFWFGNKFFEYLSHSLAIINDTQSELAALVTQNGIGNNVEPNNPKALADVLLTFLSSPAKLSRCCDNATELFLREFDGHTIYRDYARYVVMTAEINSQAEIVENACSA